MPPSRVCPFRLSAWHRRTSDFPSPALRAKVLDGLANGFRLGFTSTRLRSAKSNSHALAGAPERLSAYLAEEMAANCIAGPFSSPPVDNLHLNRVSLIPKDPDLIPDPTSPKTDNFRLIVDLSHPRGLSVNAGIPDHEASVAYVTIASVLESLHDKGPSTLFGKFDIKRAFRLVPVHPEDQHLLGMKHLGQYYVDCALPFGGRSCAKIFNECADLACFAMAKSAGSTSLTHYSDDFLSLSGNPDLALPEFNSILSTAEDMGIPLKLTKTQFPSSSVRFIGWILDAPSMTISLPGDKREKYQRLAASFASRSSASRLDLLKVSGCLMRTAEVLQHGKPFLRSLYTAAYSVPNQKDRVVLSDATRGDFAFWADLLLSWTGVSLVMHKSWEAIPDLELSTDAAGSLGLGIVYGSHWVSLMWPDIPHRPQNIAVLELIPIILSAALWGHMWARKKVLVHTDNMSVVHAINSWMPKHLHLVSLLKRLAKCAILNDFHFRAVHIPGKLNVDADLLSRNDITGFRARNPSCDAAPTSVPHQLLMDCLFPTS